MVGFTGLSGAPITRDSRVLVSRDGKRTVLRTAGGWKLYDLELALLNAEAERQLIESQIGTNMVKREARNTAITTPKRSNAHLSWIPQQRSKLDTLKRPPPNILGQTGAYQPTSGGASRDPSNKPATFFDYQVKEAPISTAKTKATKTPPEKPPTFYDYQPSTVSTPPPKASKTPLVSKPPSFYEYKRKSYGEAPTPKPPVEPPKQRFSFPFGIKKEVSWSSNTPRAEKKKEVAKSPPIPEKPKVEAKAPPPPPPPPPPTVPKAQTRTESVSKPAVSEAPEKKVSTGPSVTEGLQDTELAKKTKAVKKVVKTVKKKVKKADAGEKSEPVKKVVKTVRKTVKKAEKDGTGKKVVKNLAETEPVTPPKEGSEEVSS
ncbi:hypothetical protein NDN08_000521 [Rhodosorus marinus]|uniref:Uncharacterized protein n=1 Tax=Rhodosorus marinus TaxID=101924 RepID=A0AAV8UR75_9RHOD|nr:hypothetical protein NDN08_000521 [Rhodosorus marinus]